MNFIDKFGMPGSGNPRCGNPNDPLEGMKVRGWSSKELGNSLILSFNEPTLNDPSFVLLMSKTDDFWILLNKPRGEATCYRDRGQAHDMRDIRLK